MVIHVDRDSFAVFAGLWADARRRMPVFFHEVLLRENGCAYPQAYQKTQRPCNPSRTPSGSLRRTDGQEPVNAVVTRAYGLSFVLPYLFYTFRLSFQIVLDHFPKLYSPATIISSLVTKWKKNKPYLSC